jgi:hypothetical protein
LPNLASNRCYDCSGISASDYYNIDGWGNCVKATSGCKIMFNSKQCVNSCPYYQLGGYCYTQQQCIQINGEPSGSLCNCKYLFSVSDNLYHCYGQNEKCGAEHNQYDSDSKECGACNGSKKKVEQRAGQSDITRCSSKCIGSEIESGNNCLDNCPVNQYKINNSDGTTSCVSTCNSFILDGNICSSTCNLNFYRYDNNSCLIDCPNPYYITKIDNIKYCSTECKQNNIYKYIDNRECKENCPSYRFKTQDSKKICIQSPVNNCF